MFSVLLVRVEGPRDLCASLISTLMLAGNPSCFDQMYTLFKLYIKSDVMPLVEKKLLEFGGKKCVLRKEIEHRHLDLGFRAAQEKSPFFFKKKKNPSSLYEA